MRVCCFKTVSQKAVAADVGACDIADMRRILLLASLCAAQKPIGPFGELPSGAASPADVPASLFGFELSELGLIASAAAALAVGMGAWRRSRSKYDNPPSSLESVEMVDEEEEMEEEMGEEGIYGQTSRATRARP